MIMVIYLCKMFSSADTLTPVSVTKSGLFQSSYFVVLDTGSVDVS